MKKPLVMFLSVTMLYALTPLANAATPTFTRTGNILRVVSESNFTEIDGRPRDFGGCLMLLNTTIGGGCPNGGWVSLDCKGLTTSAGSGTQRYATALLAASLGKQVTLYVDPSKTVDPAKYCVATRIDLVF